MFSNTSNSWHCYVSHLLSFDLLYFVGVQPFVMRWQMPLRTCNICINLPLWQRGRLIHEASDTMQESHRIPASPADLSV